MDTNFILDEFKTVLLSTCNTSDDLMNTHSTHFHESLRSSPFIHLDRYLYDTVKYGDFNGTRHKLLFGGEVDFLSLSIYDILATLAIWRYFNILNDVELLQAQTFAQVRLKLGTNFGTTFKINMRQPNGSFDRTFESISSIMIVKTILDEIDKYSKFNLLNGLKERFQLFGLAGYINSIADIDTAADDLVEDQLIKLQPTIVDLTTYASTDCQYLNSIYDYCKFKREVSIGRQKYAIEQLFTLTQNNLNDILIKKFQDVIYLAYSLRYPILYNLKK